MNDPLAYFITFHTYGTWLPGNARGSVDREHSAYGTELLPIDVPKERSAGRRLKSPPLVLDPRMREVVHQTIREVAHHRNWTLHALNVRTNHVHVVVSAAIPPEKVMNALKSWSTRRLVETGLLTKGNPAWTRHGSTAYLWNEEAVAAACDYVLNRQVKESSQFESGA